MGHTINICKEHGRPQITCWDCKDAEITTLRARIAELEKRVAAKGQEVVDVLNNAERYYADFRARIAELEAWKADSLLRWQQAVTLGGQQLERIAELEREKVELMKDRDRLDWLEAEYETEQAMRRVPNYPRSLFRLNFPITREKIDEAREQACAAMKPTT